MPTEISTTLAITAAALTLALLVRWGTRWGSTERERSARMVGDSYLVADGAVRLSMTRAIDIAEPPKTVWPWLAQTGRGAGWYSWDLLDNGRRRSARHVVSWIPEPQLGDATAIGYLRDLSPGHQMSWWAPSVRYPGVEVSLVVDMELAARELGSRLVIRISAEAVGPMAHPTLWCFRLIDSIMATRQLVVLKRCVESFGTRATDPLHPATGERDQYQLYQVVYASGDWAGTYGREQAERWRRLAAEDGVL